MQRNTQELDDRWSGMLDALHAYREATGSADVPRRFRTADGRTLGTWLHRQRALWSAGRLPADRADCLAAAGVTWRVLDRGRALDALRQYLADHGDLLVPADHVTASGLALGTWIQSRRAEYRSEAPRTLSLWPELGALPFEWHSRTDPWERGLAALEQYRRDYGDA